MWNKQTVPPAGGKALPQLWLGYWTVIGCRPLQPACWSEDAYPQIEGTTLVYGCMLETFSSNQQVVPLVLDWGPLYECVSEKVNMNVWLVDRDGWCGPTTGDLFLQKVKTDIFLRMGLVPSSYWRVLLLPLVCRRHVHLRRRWRTGLGEDGTSAVLWVQRQEPRRKDGQRGNDGLDSAVRLRPRWSWSQTPSAWVWCQPGLPSPRPVTLTCVMCLPAHVLTSCAFCPLQDGRLSKQEILDNYEVFVGSQVTNFGEVLLRHDEF